MKLFRKSDLPGTRVRSFYEFEYDLDQRRLGEQLDSEDRELGLKEFKLNRAYHDPSMAAEHERIWNELCVIRQARTEIEQKLYISADEDYNL